MALKEPSSHLKFLTPVDGKRGWGVWASGGGSESAALSFMVLESSFMLSEVTFQLVFCWSLRASNSYNLERKFRKQHIIHHLCPHCGDLHLSGTTPETMLKIV